jgi:hypothetical protein
MHTRNEITACLKESSRRVHEWAGNLSETLFTTPAIEGKWSPAEHIDHLTRSVKPLNMALAMPRGFLRWFGKPNREARTYDELKKRYREKLAAGGQASGRFVPQLKSVDKQVLISRYEEQMGKLVVKAAAFKEAELDLYVLPHPLLGKITLREMFFFTIYHTYHHLDALRKKENSLYSTV